MAAVATAQAVEEGGSHFGFERRCRHRPSSNPSASQAANRVSDE
jgi:hypothetical protein